MSGAFAQKTIAFSSNASSGVGGQGEFLRQMVSALDALPCRARILARKAEAARAEVVPIPFRGASRTLAGAVRAVPWLRRRRDWLTLLDDLQFDAGVAERVGEVDLLDGVMAQCCTTFEALARSRTRLVLTCQNTHVDNLADTMEEEHRRVGWSGPTFVHPKMRARARREIELAACVRVSSALARRTFLERGASEDRVVAIAPEVDRRHFHPVEKKDDVFRVIAVASIDARKGLHYLIQAFEEARIERSELVLVGATGDRWAKRMVAGALARNANVRIVRLDVPRAPVEESYGRASVVVHPALEDGYGLVVAEALASARPVIATRQTGAAELIEDGKNGFVVESRSVPELKDRLQRVASDRTLRESMERAARETIERREEGSFAREVAALYRRLLGC